MATAIDPHTAASQAVALLRQARDLLSAANHPRAAEKVRLALKSAEGAVRHAERREMNEYFDRQREDEAISDTIGDKFIVGPA